MCYVENQSALLPQLLTKFPDLVNDETTGGAQPLHMCGISSEYQDAVSRLIAFGADIEALDIYGMTPLHRMVSKQFWFDSIESGIYLSRSNSIRCNKQASNNLVKGATLLLNAGADPYFRGQVRPVLFIRFVFHLYSHGQLSKK